MSRREFSKQVRREALARAWGHCEGIVEGLRCNAVLTIGKYHLDHENPDGQGGEPTLENCRVLCLQCHANKTRRDIKAIAKTKRIQDKHNGITTKRKKIQSRGFQKSEPQRTASRQIERRS